MQYQRNDAALARGALPGARRRRSRCTRRTSEFVVRVDFFGDEIERIVEIDALTGEVLAERREVNYLPGDALRHPRDKLMAAVVDIEAEMEERVGQLRAEGRELEARGSSSARASTWR